MSLSKGVRDLKDLKEIMSFCCDELSRCVPDRHRLSKSCSLHQILCFSLSLCFLLITIHVAPTRAEDGQVQRLVISSQNFKVYKNSLSPELGQLVRDGVFSFKVKGEVDLPWHLGEAWESRPVNSPKEISSFSDLLGYPYGGSDQLSRLSDPKDLAQAVLWNGEAALSIANLRVELLDVDLYNNGKFSRSLKLESSRIYPGAVDSAAPKSQLFRERLAIRSPETIAGSAVRSFRFFGLTEDLLWMDSRAIARTFQLTGSNRSDDLFHLPMALDDLYVWNGKIENLTATSSSTDKLYLPFAEQEILQGREEGGCIFYNQSVEDGGSDSSIESVRISPWATFARTNSLVLRDVWRLELLSNDSFYQFGRQILLVDKESHLPISRLVYDRAGTPRRLILGGLALVEFSGERFPVYSSIVIHDYQRDETVLITLNSAQLCNKGVSAKDFERFNQPTPKTTPSASEVKQEVVSEGGVVNVEGDKNDTSDKNDTVDLLDRDSTSDSTSGE